jgi:hypothetical protein
MTTNRLAFVARNGMSSTRELDNVPNSPFISSFVPRFKRVRTVKSHVVGPDTFLVCDCAHFSRTGIPCRHLWHVKSKYWNCDCPVATDIHPMWYSAYKAYAYPNVEPGSKPSASTAIEAFAKTFKREVVGPRAPAPIPDLEEAFNPNLKGFEILSAADFWTFDEMSVFH